MRINCVAAVVGIATTVLFIAPAVLIGAPSAHADLSGYRRCVGNMQQLPRTDADPMNLQTVRQVEQDLNSGASPTVETQKVTRMGFDQRAATVVVQCVMQERP